MKTFKAIIRIPLIIITSLIITALVLTLPITKIVFNQKEMVKLLDNSNIYKNISEEIKKDIIESLNESLNETPDDVKEEIDVEKLVEDVQIDSLLRNITNEALDVAYSISDKELTLKDITSKYVARFDEYIYENNIYIDEDVLNDIHKSLSDDSLDDIFEESEINDSLKEIKENVDNVKTYANLAEAILIILIIILTVIALLLSNKKTVTGVALLSIPVVLLGLIEMILSLLIKEGREEMGELLYGILSSVKGSMFKYINAFIIVFILTIIGLIVFKKVRKNKKEKTINDNQNKASDEETN